MVLIQVKSIGSTLMGENSSHGCFGRKNGTEKKNLCSFHYLLVNKKLM